MIYQNLEVEVFEFREVEASPSKPSREAGAQTNQVAAYILYTIPIGAAEGFTLKYVEQPSATLLLIGGGDLGA